MKKGGENVMTIKERVEKTFKLVAAIPVQGDNVDTMFAIRQELRLIWKALEGENADE